MSLATPAPSSPQRRTCPWPSRCLPGIVLSSRTPGTLRECYRPFVDLTMRRIVAEIRRREGLENIAGLIISASLVTVVMPWTPSDLHPCLAPVTNRPIKRPQTFGDHATRDRATNMRTPTD